MKRKKWKWLSLIIAAMLVFAGCGAQGGDGKQSGGKEASERPTDPLEMLTAGYYTYAYPVEGKGDYVFYFHFYEEQPVLGKVFYAGMANNQINFAGTYEVEKKDYEYSVYSTRERAEAHTLDLTGTAPYTITFYDFEGNVMDVCGFDGETLYNTCETISFTGSGPNAYAFDYKGEEQGREKAYEAELGVAYKKFVDPADDTRELYLNHNGTYKDLMDTLVEGTWTMKENDKGGYDYELTPEEDALDTTPVVVSTTADKNVIYQKEGKDTVALTEVSDAEVLYTLTGKVDLEAFSIMDAPVILNLYTDGSCDVSVEIYGSAQTIDQGTYEIEGYNISLAMDGGGNLTTVLENSTVALDYKTTFHDVEIKAHLVLQK